MDNQDILHCILQYLQKDEIIKCSTIDKLFKKICDQQYQRLFISDYSEFVTIFNEYSFKDAYIKCFSINIFKKIYEFDNKTLIDFFNLTILDLPSINIKELSSTIGQLVNLQKLWLGNNQIKEIPETIGQLVNLQYLLLDHNQIKEIPITIKQLVNCKIYK